MAVVRLPSEGSFKPARRPLGRPPLYLVDGSGYIFRAFYAVPPLSTASGFPTNALFGFSRMLLKLLQEAGDSPLAVVFDAGRKTFRNELYPDYKANRAECPEALLPQLPHFRRIVRAMGLPTFEVPGFEADDVIGTLVECLKPTRRDIIIVTADKDLMQLVDDTGCDPSDSIHKGSVTLWDTMRDQRVAAAQVEQKFGVPPSQVVEVLALTGDTSDNIPGISGVGPKTAAQLIQKFGTIERLIDEVAQVRSDASIRSREKVALQIEQNTEQLRLSRKLVEITTTVPLAALCSSTVSPSVVPLVEGETLNPDVLSFFTRRVPAQDELRVLGEEFEFKDFDSDVLRLIGHVQPGQPLKIAPARAQYVTITAADFDEWLPEFLAQDSYAVDIETTSLDAFEAEIVGVSFCWSNDKAYYIPIHHRVVPSEPMVQAQALFANILTSNEEEKPKRKRKNAGSKNGGLQGKVLGDLVEAQVDWTRFLLGCQHSLENAAVKKIGQNLKFDSGVFHQNGITFNGIFFDSMVAAYLVRPDSRQYSLEALAQEYLHERASSYEEVTQGFNNFAYVPIEAATTYAAEDAHFAWRLMPILLERIDREGLRDLLYQIEIPLVEVLSALELRGICIDTALLATISSELEHQLAVIQTNAYAAAGCSFNINSPKQLGEILFQTLQLPTKGLKRTKSGVPSTDFNVLEKLSPLHELPRILLLHRSLQKLKSTYVDALPLQLSRYTSRLHTKLNQTTTGTGRLSSSEPNLQNIPIQTAEGSRIRRAFISPKGSLFLAADYSQIELRVLAHLSNDELLLQAFREEIDIHEKTAREILKIPLGTSVTSEQRRLGKTINFGVVYGMSSFRLGRDLEISMEESTRYISTYFATYHGVKRYFDRVRQEAEARGYVETLFGRRRYLNDIDATSKDKGFLARVAMNAPVQGTAADIIKIAMIRVEKALREHGLGSRMVLQIHDELLFECPEQEIDDAGKIVAKSMEEAVSLKVPMKIRVGIGKNWQEAH